MVLQSCAIQLANPVSCQIKTKQSKTKQTVQNKITTPATSYLTNTINPTYSNLSKCKTVSNDAADTYCGSWGALVPLSVVPLVACFELIIWHMFAVFVKCNPCTGVKLLVLYGSLFPRYTWMCLISGVRCVGGFAVGSFVDLCQSCVELLLLVVLSILLF